MTQAATLARAAAIASATTTGMQYTFTVTTIKADESDLRAVRVTVLATNHAQAWERIGRAIELFMNGPHGRFVLYVALVRGATHIPPP